jgi:hypothetical protein
LITKPTTPEEKLPAVAEPRPPMQAIDSSNIRSVGYSPKANQLFVQFSGGDLYVYFDVLPEIYNGLMQAASKGQFIARAIKDRYAFKKLEHLGRRIAELVKDGTPAVLAHPTIGVVVWEKRRSWQRLPPLVASR